MEQTKLGLLEREFVLFESKIKELKQLKRELDSLNTEGFEDNVALIEGKLSDIDNIPKIQKLIANLKLKIEKREVSSKSRLAQLIEQVFECNDKINTWSPKRLSKEYLFIYKKYNALSRREKAIVYSTIIKLYNGIKQR